GPEYGTESRGLYYLQPSTTTICVAAESPELLHRRLGGREKGELEES
ncbi:hypothetical protein L195_g048944, partial [Trifolium pratense]